MNVSIFPRTPVAAPPIVALSVAALLFLALGGCGGQPEEGALTGSVRIDGSSTVYPITEAVAEEFMLANRSARVTVGVSGTGGGFSKFLRSETDLNDASRSIGDVEMELAEQNGVEFIELPVAYDGLAVVVNPENEFLQCLTVAELRSVWEAGSTMDSWNDIRSDFPNQPLTLYGPGTDSGTYDYFSEAVLGGSGASRSDFTASEDDNVLVQGIAGDVNALGFFGLAYYEENQSRLKLLGVDDENPGNGAGCIEPSAETVGNGTYAPLSRPLLLYVRLPSLDEEAVEAFVDFYLEYGGALASEVGYIALTDGEYELTRERFDRRITGSMFAGDPQVGVTMDELLEREMNRASEPEAEPGSQPSAEPDAEPRSEPDAGPGSEPDVEPIAE